MTGLGKSRRGLGKESTKCHRNIFCDNIQCITKPAIRRLAGRGGVKRICGLIHEKIEVFSKFSLYIRDYFRNWGQGSERYKKGTFSLQKS